MEEEKPWIDVPGRRPYSGKKNKEANGDVAKFYVTNLPDGCTLWEVSNFLGAYGEVIGTYIARKKDKEGNKFGFVTFRYAKMAKEIEQNINGLKMGQNKLRVNIAKFAAENISLGDPRTSGKSAKEETQPAKLLNRNTPFMYSSTFSNGGGPSFSQMVRKGLGNPVRDPPTSEYRERTKELEIQEESRAFQDLHGRALIGRAKDVTMLRKLKVSCAEEGLGGFDIVYIGGLSVCLKFRNSEEASTFLLKQEIWKNWFTNLDIWDGQVLSFERIQLSWIVTTSTGRSSASESWSGKERR
ncbi:putative RNA recognition motif domain, nucleotide-binding alpha-beta plait domain superfamily [Helianthus annuus]|nr:putative RNA recognition motif domain, nucleotide-binding alpha-beta plait domain superfamily [Helianthus annuus]KAJ0563251.1 putative RNA recognition motif domain, nucleotide-binding alpha-beta plait domain superfamily [Helianthus annuus]KAJ0731356.1 putative RNA recognition motif domain, nucleotide-binding alpha-beta plait domain superfamily [Helianthus annuus]